MRQGTFTMATVVYVVAAGVMHIALNMGVSVVQYIMRALAYPYAAPGPARAGPAEQRRFCTVTRRADVDKLSLLIGQLMSNKLTYKDRSTYWTLIDL